MAEAIKKPEIIGQDFYPQGKAAYVAANLALMDIRAALVACDFDEGSTTSQKKAVSYIKNTIRQISDHDDHGLFHPPLENFSGTIKSELEYAEDDDAYIEANAAGLISLDRAKIQETSMIIAAIVNHGLSGSREPGILA